MTRDLAEPASTHDSIRVPARDQGLALPPDLIDELEALAVQVAQRCGRLIVDERPRDLDVASTKSSATDVVTIMDRRSEDLAHRLLLEGRPHDGLLGEEGTGIVGTSGISWVVDPIDGTVNYLYDIPAYAVSIAAVVGDPRVPGGWYPVAGAVTHAVLGQTYRAGLGRGARLEAADGSVRALRHNPAPLLEASLLSTGFGYLADVRAAQGRVIATVLPQVRDIRRIGSAALDLCAIASGQTDVYYERGLNAWDLAAGWLVAVESGATIRGLDQDTPGAAVTLAGAPGPVEELAVILRSCGVAD